MAASPKLKSIRDRAARKKSAPSAGSPVRPAPAPPRKEIPPALVHARVTTLQEFVGAIEAICKTQGGELWFRGHSKGSYVLAPSLFRNIVGLSEQQIRQREERLNRRFRDRSMPYGHQGRTDSLDVSPIQSWWRLFAMQHYGIPTRLLDWSENAFTALCFAVLDAAATPDEDAVVWSLNPREWNRTGNVSTTTAISVDEHPALPYSPLPSEHSRTETIWPLAVYGMHSNPRISIQQGTFVVFPPGKTNSMEEHIVAAAGTPKPIAAILIDKDSVSAVAKQLRLAGFRMSGLYPDLTGLAQDLRADLGN